MIATLSETLGGQPVDVEELLARLRRYRPSVPGELTDSLVAEARKKGRP